MTLSIELRELMPGGGIARAVSRYNRFHVDEGAKSGRAESEVELAAAVRASLDSGDVAGATTQVVQGHGPEILGYLMAMTRREIDAHDAFAQFSEDVWRGLAGFRWQASLRTWCYVVARNALRRQWSGAPERHGLHVSPSQVPELHELAERMRTATAEYVRTETKSRFALLREQLEPDDRTLLILRVDRRMGWRDIAAVLGEPIDPAGLERRAAKLRKRFERLKHELRAQLGVGEE